MKRTIFSPISFLLVFTAMLALSGAFQSLYAQDPILDNPRISPPVMKGRPRGTMPSVFRTVERPRTPSGAVDWKQWIDSAWGAGLSTQEKLAIFDDFWGRADRNYGGFPNLEVDWDSIRDHYRPIVEAGVSRGRFYGIMSRMANELMEYHVWIVDKGINQFFQYPDTWYFWPTGRAPLLTLGGWGNSTSGMGVVPMPDSSLFLYRAQPGNPLAMEPGDILLGYDGMTWKDILHLFDSVEVPIVGYYSLIGSDPESYEYSRLNAAPINWYMFDTMDVVRYATGDTVHLSTQPLADAPFFWDSLYTQDAIPVPGVPMPDPYQNQYTTWGVIEGTSIGYIYLHNWAQAESTNFKQAVEQLMHTTTGLIIDTRVNFGGWMTTQNGGFSLLFNENPDTLFEVWHRLNTANRFSFWPEPVASVYWAGPFNPTPDVYDHPIAVLTGPKTVSAGDYSAFRLRFHPMVRSFGKRSNTGYVDGYYTTGPLAGNLGWSHKISRGSGYSLVNGEGFLIHKGFPVDEEVWHNRDDAANGIDAVVKRAVEWIDSSCYSHDVAVDKFHLLPGSDTLTITSWVENPNDHPISVRALLYRNGGLMDSVDLVQDTVFYPEPRGACLGSWPAPRNGGTYEVSVRTTDPLTGLSFHLRRLAQVTVAGPVIYPYSVDFGLSHSDTIRTDTVVVVNPSEVTLNISSASIDLPLEYSVAPPAAVIAPHDSATFVVTFDPAVYGTYEGHLIFTHDGAGSPSQIAVTGNYSPQSVQFQAGAGWNLVSVPMNVEDFAKNAVFPGSNSAAFHYETGYHEQTTLVQGEGYWLKYGAAGPLEVPGLPVELDTIPLVRGWNLVGSITYPVAVSSIGSDPPGIVTTQFYAYSPEGGYSVADTIRPGYGYWVKTNAAGSLILSASGNIPAAKRIAVVPTGEAPPAPPDGNPGVAEQPIPTEYALGQNYPNPFNPVTTINYQLPSSGHVTLAVLDLLGREVGRLVDGPQEAGYRTVTFDAARLPSGVYFYKLTAGGFTATKKLLIMK